MPAKRPLSAPKHARLAASPPRRLAAYDSAAKVRIQVAHARTTFRR